MPDFQNLADDPTSGDTQSNIYVSHSQPETYRAVQLPQRPGLDTGMQPGFNQCYIEQPPPAHVHQLEMEVQRQRGVIERVLRLVWPPYAPGINAEAQLIRGDSNTHEVVTKGFVAQAHRNNAKLDEVTQAFNEKIEECDRIREQWQAVVGELSDLKSSKQIFMVDDAEMTAKWKQLQYSIRNLARTYLRSAIAPEQLTQNHRELLKSISSLYREFLRADGRTHLLFQSLMWTYITHRILQNPTMIWGQKVSSAAETLFELRQSKLCTKMDV